MKTRNKLLTMMILSSSVASSIAVINKYLKMSATSKNILEEKNSHSYKWRLGDVYYTKTGNGKPLLLIHNLNSFSCGYEWSKIINLLKDNFTVYTIDLLGCGRSEKPNMTYTNYLYVQLISDFIKSVIGHRTSVISSGESASILFMACANEPDLFDQLMMINPLSIIDYSRIPNHTAKIYKHIIDSPILGTFLYHIAVSKKMIRETLKKEVFYNSAMIPSSLSEAMTEASHLGFSAKSVFSSQRCNFTKCNVCSALKKIDNSIYLVGGSEVKNIREILEEYNEYNPAIETFYIPKTRLLPQQETPGLLYELIKTCLL